MKEHPDFQPAYLLTLAALMYHVNLEPANEFFSRCYPLVKTIQSAFGQGRRAVFEALAWLRANDYVYSERRGAKSSLYTVILRRERFRQVKVREGLDAAKSDYEAWIEERGLNSRAEKAEVARERVRQEANSNRLRPESPECPSLHFRRSQDSASIEEVHLKTRLGVRGATRVLQCTQNKIHQIGGTRIMGEQDSGKIPPEAQSLPKKEGETPKGDVQERYEDRQIAEEGLRMFREMMKHLASKKTWPG